ncbi:PLP-dependent aminotransferase family protein [Burkholderia sp. BCC1993]|uniref:aminotransferase-like domain-containing protein n=1 Tax=Burkholderia sp. BCC1993 TaxID=2817444 RepID=UPI002AB1E8AA|nr:PLP-dependent aminotransferase family protein [Burkholderia sp. BCC1993]
MTESVVRYSKRMRLVKPSAIRELHLLEHDPEVISFCGGYPDASMFPVNHLREAYCTVIERDELALQYTHSQGDLSLRQKIVAKMHRDGVSCDEDEVLIVHGGQQGLDLLGKAFIDEGDAILVEAPTFLGALISFNAYAPQYVGIPMDDHGIDTDRLEEILRRTTGVKFMYVIPDFQNPAGVTLSLERRKRLVELAEEHDFYIVEDSPYRDIRFSGQSVPPIKHFDTNGRVIFVGSFSKSLVPGMRLGWVVGDKDLVRNLAQLKQAADTQCSTVNMKVANAYLESFDHDTHVGRLADGYRKKKQLMLDVIRASFPDCVAYTNPEGGMFTWLTFPETFDAGVFLKNVLLPESKVAYVPGMHFFAGDGVVPVNHARLSYSATAESAIIDGVTRMGKQLHVHLC